MQGGTFGAAVDANDNAWLTSYGGKSIAVFDKNGKPLLSWRVLILPFIEQQAVYSQFNMSYYYRDSRWPQNQAAAQTQLVQQVLAQRGPGRSGNGSGILAHARLGKAQSRYHTGHNPLRVHGATPFFPCKSLETVCSSASAV